MAPMSILQGLEIPEVGRETLGGATQAATHTSHCRGWGICSLGDPLLMEPLDSASPPAFGLSVAPSNRDGMAAVLGESTAESSKETAAYLLVWSRNLSVPCPVHPPSPPCRVLPGVCV